MAKLNGRAWPDWLPRESTSGVQSIRLKRVIFTQTKPHPLTQVNNRPIQKVSKYPARCSAAKNFICNIKPQSFLRTLHLLKDDRNVLPRLLFRCIFGAAINNQLMSKL